MQREYTHVPMRTDRSDKATAQDRINDIMAGGRVLSTDLALLQPLRPVPYTDSEELRLKEARLLEYKDYEDKQLAKQIAHEISRRTHELELVARYH